MQVNAVQSMKVKQSQLQPLLLSPIACGLIQHTKRGRKRSLCKACFTYRHQMWQQCRGRRRGEADAASGGTCCLWQLWDAFQPPRGPSWDISKATLETVTVTKGCPRVLRVCVRECVCWGCASALCPLTCHRLQYVYCIWLSLFFLVFDSIITLFKMFLVSALARNWFDCLHNGARGRQRGS